MILIKYTNTPVRYWSIPELVFSRAPNDSMLLYSHMFRTKAPILRNVKTIDHTKIRGFSNKASLANLMILIVNLSKGNLVAIMVIEMTALTDNRIATAS